MLAVALADLLPLVPLAWHLAVLVISAIAILVAALPLRHFRYPTREEAIRRLEKDPALAHRPLTALNDRPAGEQTNASLWHKHQLTAATALENLTPQSPISPVPAKDRNALRFAALIILVSAIIIGRQDPGERLVRAFLPGGVLADPEALTVEAWVTPPAYTALPPLFLSLDRPPDPAAPPQAPQGSTIKLHIAGAEGSLSASIGNTALETVKIDKLSFKAEGIVEGGDTLIVRSNKRIFVSWPLTILPDVPPKIALINEPTAHPETQELQLQYRAFDDYSIDRTRLSLRLTDGEEHQPQSLTLPTPRNARTVQSFRRDLTAHPWAGREVEMILRARDGAGQEGESRPVVFILPERIFKHPVARRLAEERKRLTKAGPTRLDVASNLGILAGRPERFGHDNIIVLGLSVAESRLIYNADRPSIESVRALLWDMALRLDQGLGALARRDLLEAEEALQEALRQGADQETLERLMDQMAEAMRHFLEQMTENIDPNDIPDLPLPEGLEAVGQDELNRMLEEARRLMRMGDRKGAQELMAQLRQMLENLQTEKPENLGEALAKSKELIDRLDTLEKAQRQQLDKTFKQLNAPADGSPPTDGQDNAAEQSALREELQSLMKQFEAFTGDSPQALKRADDAMDRAAQSLKRQRLDVGRQYQSEAVDQLRRAQREATKMLGQALSKKGLQTFSKPGAEGGGPDPFGKGRPSLRNGPITGNGPKIPGQPQIDRAGTILDELRRRLNDPTRRKLERDYIERLLKMY